MQKLDCVVQDYAWGDPESIPALLGRSATGEPQAEMWMGAHPKAPSLLGGQSLAELIAADPEHFLGAETTERYGRLPFLFKVLAAGQPLSIQAHPSLDQAQAGFARENKLGIDLGAPNRTYRDDNHKPELICAITPFVGKCGFRPLAEAQDLFAALAIDAMTEQLEGPVSDGPVSDGPVSDGPVSDGPVSDGTVSDRTVLAATLAWLLRLTDDEATDLVRSVVAAAEARLAAGDATAKQYADELEWTATINDYFPDDIGVVVALLLNHVVLQPGDAVFLDAGNLHVYLRGTGMELMANSDNVVRGGCTPKHIDVEELLSVVDCTPIDPPIQRATGSAHTFVSAVDEFSLSRYELSDTAVSIEPISAEIVIVESGTATLAGDDSSLVLSQGEVGFVAKADGAYQLTGTGTTFRASVGSS